MKDAICVVVEWLIKVGHFILIRSTNSACDLAPIYMKEIVRLLGVAHTLASIRDVQYVHKFLGELTRCFW